MPVRRRKHAIHWCWCRLLVTTEADLMPNRSLVRCLAARIPELPTICWVRRARHRIMSMRMRRPHDGRGSRGFARTAVPRELSAHGLVAWAGCSRLIHAGFAPTQGIRPCHRGQPDRRAARRRPDRGVSRIINTPAGVIGRYTDFRLNHLNPQAFHLFGLGDQRWRSSSPIRSARSPPGTCWSTSGTGSSSGPIPSSVLPQQHAGLPVGWATCDQDGRAEQMAEGPLCLSRGPGAGLPHHRPLYMFRRRHRRTGGAVRRVLDVVGSTDKRFRSCLADTWA